MKYYGYDLFHKGLIALSECERNGILIDIPYVKEKIQELEKEIKELEEKVYGSENVKRFSRKYKLNFNYNSDVHLRKFLFEFLGYKPVKKTETGAFSVDSEVLGIISDETSKNILRIRKLTKISKTYLSNILKETSEDGYLHPFFHLHIASSYRSSSSNINFQNIPKRDKEANKIVRSAIIPPAGYRILEVDYSGMEVLTAACYNKDQNFVDYVSDPTKDMHRDMAAEIFCVPHENVSKELRYVAKNGFVFPEFYGEYWKNCAEYMLKMVEMDKIKFKDGTDVLKHLSKKRMRKLEQFEKHVQKVEDHFWNDLFFEYARWKERFYELYVEQGYIDTYTGFRLWGHMRRNVVINSAIQASAFHILLLAFYFVVGYLIKNKMKTKVIGQIHDSIVLYVHESEFDEVVKVIKYITTEKVREIWDWIIVPLAVEFEASDYGRPWSEKKEIMV